jgi:hypothetical protein
VINVSEHETIYFGLRIPLELHALIKKVSKSRGEGASSFARRAILKELASLSFLSDEQKKSLGIGTQDNNTVEVPVQ